jgi:hypothetical protein
MSDDYYRQQAQDAQAQADRSRNDLDRASWLRIAQSWLGLISRRTTTAQRAFEDAEAKHGTHQDISKASQ